MDNNLIFFIFLLFTFVVIPLWIYIYFLIKNNFRVKKLMKGGSYEND